MKLQKLKFKEMKVPKKTFLLITIGFCLFVIGMSTNFIVIQNNQGRMPVWTDSFIDTDIHFTITDIDEVEQLQFADLFNIKGNMFSIGDFFLISGAILILMAVLIMIYNTILNYIIYYQGRKKKNVRS